MNVVTSLPTLAQLRQHVLTTLCAHDFLDPAQTPLFESAMVRAGRPCGLFFQIQGPRQVKTYAIWASQENRILFYDSAGIRFAETRLSESPPVQESKRVA